ncbi:hypothetical protein JX265_001874 [Neoarthrinium moseri]|uniref:Alpha/beta hydrolase fold-3 domain-containing protein n=1 Tax=Neoarthrinium moseri TaxID=1658444 RepID=A0A9P9WVZ7_9PEZI|nr:uncharacterized protein JN550_005625 [Neoarthrinium moseri]KAI1869644.1 hypothetical protein JN550_005625 [Neoarthrinium moseri]KAI1880253.1 hypothetical protein JX265_001874 [Neoarthrinium moseri]
MSRPNFVHPDYWALLGGEAPPTRESLAPPADLHEVREQFNGAMEAAYSTVPYPAGVTESIRTATSTDGSEISVTRFVPLAAQDSSGSSSGTAQRAIVFLFGGGLVAGSVEISRNSIAHIAHLSATQVFAPSYRLIPEHPFPAALEDVYSTVAWLQAHAGEFNVDPARIVLLGVSAGGNLAAAAALKARDDGLDPPIAAQVLRYPMLDDRTRLDPADPRGPYLVSSPGVGEMLWKGYLGRTVGSRETGEQYAELRPPGQRRLTPERQVPYLAAPARAEDMQRLPPAHIGVGSLDLLRDECISYAARLAAQNVAVQFNLYPGVPHGFDGSPAFTLGAEMLDNEARFIRKF